MSSEIRQTTTIDLPSGQSFTVKQGGSNRIQVSSAGQIDLIGENNQNINKKQLWGGSPRLSKIHKEFKIHIENQRVQYQENSKQGKGSAIKVCTLNFIDDCRYPRKKSQE